MRQNRHSLILEITTQRDVPRVCDHFCTVIPRLQKLPGIRLELCFGPWPRQDYLLQPGGRTTAAIEKFETRHKEPSRFSYIELDQPVLIALIVQRVATLWVEVYVEEPGEPPAIFPEYNIELSFFKSQAMPTTTVLSYGAQRQLRHGRKRDLLEYCFVPEYTAKIFPKSDQHSRLGALRRVLINPQYHHAVH